MDKKESYVSDASKNNKEDKDTDTSKDVTGTLIDEDDPIVPILDDQSETDDEATLQLKTEGCNQVAGISYPDGEAYAIQAVESEILTLREENLKLKQQLEMYAYALKMGSYDF